VLDTIANYCKKQGLLEAGDSVVIGLSGGADSLCLFDVLHKLAPQLNLSLTVAHLNHQLRGQHADADASFVRQLARRRQIPVVIDSADVAHLANQRKQSLEEAARQVRYAFLWQVAQTSGSNKIAVGHNADDNVETILMHFLRGSGLSGLRGILPAISIDGLRLQPDDLPVEIASPAPQLVRPLLETSRAAIEAYCRNNGLSPQHDHTNLDTTYFRNRLRHELIPYLESFNPNLRHTLQRTAHVVIAETDLLAVQLEQAWEAVVLSQSATHVSFAAEPWRQIPLALKRSTLRRAIERLRRGLRDIGFDHIESAVDLIETGKTGTQGTLPQGLHLSIGYNAFEITTDTTRPILADFPQVRQPVDVNLPGQTRLPASRWRLTAEIRPAHSVSRQDVYNADPWETYLAADAIGSQAVLRPRQPGDTFCPLGMSGQHKKINEFMINEKIPAHWRDCIPVLVADGRVLWVCGYRPDDRTQVKPDTRQILHLKFSSD
jgi:tRNA(Ile)-lysidine synthase